MFTENLRNAVAMDFTFAESALSDLTHGKKSLYNLGRCLGHGLLMRVHNGEHNCYGVVRAGAFDLAVDLDGSRLRVRQVVPRDARETVKDNRVLIGPKCRATFLDARDYLYRNGGGQQVSGVNLNSTAESSSCEADKKERPVTVHPGVRKALDQLPKDGPLVNRRDLAILLGLLWPDPTGA